MNFKEIYEEEIKNCNAMSDIEQYCFDEFSNVSASFYFKIAEKCREYGITKVYDIGCAVPFQSKIFKAYGIKYIGIDNDSSSFVGWAQDNRICHGVRNYPFHIEADNTSCIVSSYCLGYFSQGKETYEQMQKDFRYFCGFIGTEKEFDKFHEYFSIMEAISTRLPLCFADRDGKENKLALQDIRAIYKKLEHPVVIEFGKDSKNKKEIKR